MRVPILFFLCALIGHSASAQLTLLPQAGFENSMTKVKLNDGASFSPSGEIFSPQASLRLNYLFKQAHGPYLGIATTRSVVNMTFHDPENAATNYVASNGKTQLRLEGGYLVSTKKIFLGKGASKSVSGKRSTAQQQVRSRCSKYSSLYEGKSKMRTMTSAPTAKGTWMRIQPSIGLAYMPFEPSFPLTYSPSSMLTYQYQAGNARTALVSGLGFEFGRGKKSSFMLSVNYLNSLGKSAETITAMQSNKPTVSTFQSRTSMWSVRMGIPINLSKKQVVTQKLHSSPVKYQQQKKCGQRSYQCRHRCSKGI